GQNGDRRLVPRHGNSARHAPNAGITVAPFHAIDLHPPRDVLELSLAERSDWSVDLARDLFLDRAGDADTAGFGHLLQACRDIDPGAQKLVALGHHVAEIDADAELHAPSLGKVGVATTEPALNRDRGAHRLYRALELGDHAVAG